MGAMVVCLLLLAVICLSGGGYVHTSRDILFLMDGRKCYAMMFFLCADLHYYPLLLCWLCIRRRTGWSGWTCVSACVCCC